VPLRRGHAPAAPPGLKGGEHAASRATARGKEEARRRAGAGHVATGEGRRGGRQSGGGLGG
jgi:hypothetical protein